MLDVFVATLIFVSQSTVTAQDPAVPASELGTVSSADGGSQRHAETFIHCQDVQNLTPDSARNDFSPLSGKILRRLHAPPQGPTLAWIAALKPNVIELKSPRHGKVNVVGAASYHYNFSPDKGYTGKDRVSYAIEAQGKRFKVTINFWVVPVVMEASSYDGQECVGQKFDGSAIEPEGINVDNPTPPSLEEPRSQLQGLFDRIGLDALTIAYAGPGAIVDAQETSPDALEAPGPVASREAQAEVIRLTYQMRVSNADSFRVFLDQEAKRVCTDFHKQGIDVQVGCTATLLTKPVHGTRKSQTGTPVGWYSLRRDL